MKVLLVEDNARLVDRIKRWFGHLYLIDIASNGKEALSKLAEVNYGVIILDLGLPDMTGLEICERARNMNIDTPILILTGEDDMQSRVRLLESGADDYITKPFDTNELRARLSALARRQPMRANHSLIIYQDLEIDVNQRKAYRSGSHIPLRRKEFDILEYLVRNNGRVLTREMIINHAWDSSKLNWNSTVNVHIKHLRDKIDRPFPTQLIKTAYGLGYRVDAIE